METLFWETRFLMCLKVFLLQALISQLVSNGCVSSRSHPVLKLGTGARSAEGSLSTP